MSHSLETFIALESSVWRALIAGDEQADRSLLSETFLGVYPTGFATRDEHVGQLANGPTIRDFSIGDAQIRSVAEHAVLFCYRATFTRTTAEGATAHGVAEQMYVSSLWERDQGEWKNTFSQDTPTS